MERIPIANTYIGEEEARAVYEVIKSGWISMGNQVKAFEDAVRRYCDAGFAVAMNNGTSTLQAILMAMDIGPGDEVILPSLTYISTANVVLFQGAKPVLCDSNPETFNAEPQEIKRRITGRTRAFITVDMKGLPVDYGGFSELSRETGIPFISDSAESLGAAYRGRRVGIQAAAHSFSFFANKNITCGEGGMVVTNDEGIYKKLLIIRNQGQEGRYNHTLLGNNFRMTDMQAAFGLAQLRRLEWILAEKEKIADRYTKSFSGIKGITAPSIPAYVNRHSWYMYSIKVSRKIRDGLVQELEDNKIETRLSFPPVHIQPYYQKRFGFRAEDFPLSYGAYQEFLDIPIWAGLKEEDQERIIKIITSFVRVR